MRTQRYRYDLQEDGQEGRTTSRSTRGSSTSFHNDPRYAAIKAILKPAALRLSTCQGKTCRVNVGRLPEPGAG